MVDSSKNAGNSGVCEELLVGDDEGERSVASAEDQLRNEMTVYEVTDDEILFKYYLWLTLGGDSATGILFN